MDISPTALLTTGFIAVVGELYRRLLDRVSTLEGQAREASRDIAHIQGKLED